MTRFLSFSGAAPQPTQASSGPSAALRVLPSPIVGRIMPTSSSLNLRENANTQAKVLREMPKFDSLLITAVGDTWCAVEYEGITGYCMTKYLEFDLYD